jgi:flavin-dependent dehydrogenase
MGKSRETRRTAHRAGQRAPRAAAAVPESPDVLILGAHPCADLAAAVLAHDRPDVRSLCVATPDNTPDDRILPFNPRLFDLHPVISRQRPLADEPHAAGLLFLSEQPGVCGQYVSTRQPAILLTSLRRASDAMRKVADAHGVRRIDARHFVIDRVVDDGVRVRINDQPTTARTLLIAAGGLPSDQRRMLGIGDGWESGVMHRCGYLRISADLANHVALEKRLVPMSLDLSGSGAWAWMLTGHDNHAQLILQQPMRSTRRFAPERLMRLWIEQLAMHGLLRSAEAAIAGIGETTWLDLPVTGALSGETVANRTLLIGPAGGFYSACGEELYPSCWSAVAAAQVLGKALSAPHVQDALQSYRQQWGNTLGDYLRGPQQNLSLLLPLVYRNAVMAGRVGDAILLGESVVR